MKYVEYRSNNSGGSWWLTDQNWLDLEKAGWEVRWYRDDKSGFHKGDRFLGALASYATRRGLSLRDAATEWEKITGLDATDAGCPCCGQPHTFTEYTEDGKYVASGPDADYECHW